MIKRQCQCDPKYGCLGMGGKGGEREFKLHACNRNLVGAPGDGVTNVQSNAMHQHQICPHRNVAPCPTGGASPDPYANQDRKLPTHANSTINAADSLIVAVAHWLRLLLLWLTAHAFAACVQMSPQPGPKPFWLKPLGS